jgi:hypothetical protein
MVVGVGSPSAKVVAVGAFRIHVGNARSVDPGRRGRAGQRRFEMSGLIEI